MPHPTEPRSHWSACDLIFREGNDRIETHRWMQRVHDPTARMISRLRQMNQAEMEIPTHDGGESQERICPETGLASPGTRQEGAGLGSKTGRKKGPMLKRANRMTESQNRLGVGITRLRKKMGPD